MGLQGRIGSLGGYLLVCGRGRKLEFRRGTQVNDFDPHGGGQKIPQKNGECGRCDYRDKDLVLGCSYN